MNLEGITGKSIVDTRYQTGRNEIQTYQSEGFFSKLFGNFKDPLILMLFGALVIIVVLSFLGYTQWYESAGIALAIFLATFVSTLSEYKNEKSFQKLQSEASKIIVKVVRDGSLKTISIGNIVVGDYVLLQSGDMIPADGFIVRGDIKVDQSSMTGESVPISKVQCTNMLNFKACEGDFNNPNLVYRGTVVCDGEALMVVSEVGMQTYYGKMMSQTNETEEVLSPLQEKLKTLSVLISKIGMWLAIIISISYLGKSWIGATSFTPEMIIKDIVTAFIISAIVIVVAVPEGLPMMISIVLALNMKKLLNAKVLVLNLLGIETCGSMDVLCLDKTGTLTEGKLSGTYFISPTGVYSPFSDTPISLRRLIVSNIRLTNSCFIEGEKISGGNRVDKTLLEYISGSRETETWYTNMSRVTDQITFNSERKYSLANCLTPNDFTQLNSTFGENTSFIKGSASVLLPKCPYYYNENGEKTVLDSLTRNNYLDKLKEYSNRNSLQFIAIVSGQISDNEVKEIKGGVKELPSDLTLIGCIGLKDSLRSDAKQAVKKAQQAGIHVIMITGDRLEVARNIGNECKLLSSGYKVITSKELNKLTDSELSIAFDSIGAVAEATPLDKLRIVEIGQKLGHVVGMTGDGVNDSPALRKADVGIGLGSGTDLAKSVSDLVVLDDKLDSIMNAVLYGRTIYRSIKKFLAFQLSVNFSVLAIMLIGPYIGFILPFTMIQLLWINLIIDTLAALSFSCEPAKIEYLKDCPISRTEPIMNSEIIWAITYYTVFMVVLSIVFLLFLSRFYLTTLSFMTGFFTLFIFTSNWNRYNCRLVGENNIETLLNLSNRNFLGVTGLIILV